MGSDEERGSEGGEREGEVCGAKERKTGWLEPGEGQPRGAKGNEEKGEKDPGGDTSGTGWKRRSTAAGESETTTEARNTEGTVHFPIAAAPPKLLRCSAEVLASGRPLDRLCRRASDCAECFCCRHCVQIHAVVSDYSMSVASRLPDRVDVNILYPRGAMLKLLQLFHPQWIVHFLRHCVILSRCVCSTPD